MIRYEAHTEAAASDELALRSYLVQEVSAVYDTMGEEKPYFVSDVAATVTDVCRIEFQATTVPETFLGLLVSHALWSTGDEVAARAALCRHEFGRGGGDRILISLFESGRPSLALCMIISFGYVRPSTSTLSGNRPMWILELDLLFDDRKEALELGWTRELRWLLAHLAQVWDGSKGCGVLGVAQRRESVESTQYCVDVLIQCADARGWTDIPEVQNRRLRSAP